MAFGDSVLTDTLVEAQYDLAESGSGSDIVTNTNVLKLRCSEPLGGEWFDSQADINQLTQKIIDQNPSVTSVKVIETFRETLNIQYLLDNLPSSHFIHHVAFILGTPFDGTNASKLARALQSPVCELRSLQLCRLRPDAIVPLCQGLKKNTTLRSLRMTFKNDIESDELRLLLEAIKEMKQLETLKLFGLTFDEPCIKALADLLSENPKLHDLRITCCTMIASILPFAKAIRDFNCIRHLDLSMNSLDDYESLILLLQTPQILQLLLSQNKFGLFIPLANEVCAALAHNTSLEEIDLGMNPLSLEFSLQLEQALKQNTTLYQFWLLSVPWARQTSDVFKRIEHIVCLNEAGRGLIRQKSSSTSLLPSLFARSSVSANVLFGLLKEDPVYIVQDVSN